MHSFESPSAITKICFLCVLNVLVFQVMEKLQKMLLQFELHILYLQPVAYTILKLKLSVREEMGKQSAF